MMAIIDAGLTVSSLKGRRFPPTVQFILLVVQNSVAVKKTVKDRVVYKKRLRDKILSARKRRNVAEMDEGGKIRNQLHKEESTIRTVLQKEASTARQ